MSRTWGQGQDTGKGSLLLGFWRAGKSLPGLIYTNVVKLAKATRMEHEKNTENKREKMSKAYHWWCRWWPSPRSLCNGKAFQKLPKRSFCYYHLFAALEQAIKGGLDPWHLCSIVIGTLNSCQCSDYSFHTYRLTILPHLKMWLVKWNKFKLENLVVIF